MNFPCQHCIGRIFSRPEDLKQHMSSRVHSFGCPKCGKTFITKLFRQQHINDTHSKTNSNKCDNCKSKQIPQQHLASPAHAPTAKRCKRPSSNQQVAKQQLTAPVKTSIHIHNHLSHSTQPVRQYTTSAHPHTNAPNTTTPKRPKKPGETKVEPRRGRRRSV